MKIVFFGSNEISLASLKHLNENNIEILKVWTNKDKPHKRSKKLIPTPVKIYCEENNIEVSTSKITPQDLETLKPDAIIVVSYGHILDEQVLSCVPHQFFNLHFSLLPNYRGPAPVQYALLNGDKVTGLTIFEITKGVDSGPIIDKREVNIKEDENSTQLLTRLSQLGANFLLERINDGKLDKTNKNRIEQKGEITYTQKLLKKDGEIDFSKDDESNYNKIRAYSLNPGAWFTHKDKRIIISKAKLDNGKLTLLEVKPEGKNFMTYKAWMNGLR